MFAAYPLVEKLCCGAKDVVWMLLCGVALWIMCCNALVWMQ
jgi:hypothetical protein